MVKAVRGGYDGQRWMARDVADARDFRSECLADGVAVLGRGTQTCAASCRHWRARSSRSARVRRGQVQTVQRDGTCAGDRAGADAARRSATAAQRLALQLADELGVVVPSSSCSRRLTGRCWSTSADAATFRALTIDGRAPASSSSICAVLTTRTRRRGARDAANVLGVAAAAGHERRRAADTICLRECDAKLTSTYSAGVLTGLAWHINFLGLMSHQLCERAELAAHWLSHGGDRRMGTHTAPAMQWGTGQVGSAGGGAAPMTPAGERPRVGVIAATATAQMGRRCGGAGRVRHSG